MRNRHPELLIPASSLEVLKTAVMFGADAVYIGGEAFGLRAKAKNFSMEDMKEGVQFAHEHGARVHVTVNILAHNDDLEGAAEYLKELKEIGPDALIIADPAIFMLAKEICPEIERHVSTQANNTNYGTFNFWWNLGAKRVVTARELSLKEIREIRAHIPAEMEIESFIHGAMCTCFSGRCALSNYVTNRDANRGGCAQVCRFAFDYDGTDKFTLATKDLNMAIYIKDLIDVGVSSLKVEGRMRSLYYLATVIGSYRFLIDNIYDGTLTDEKLKEYEKRLDSVANRDTTSQYFNHLADVTDQYYTGRQEVSNQEYLGLIIGYDDVMKSIVLKERNYFKVGDEVEIFTPTGEIYPYKIETIYNEDNEKIEVARHPEEILKLPFDTRLIPYSMIRLIKKG